MTDLIEDTSGKIRSLPISSRLRRILIAAGELSGVDTVRVTSGGQMALGKAISLGAKKISKSRWQRPGHRSPWTWSRRLQTRRPGISGPRCWLITMAM